MVGLEINPPTSGVETPKRKRKKTPEERRNISEGMQKAWACKHYEKAMGLWGAPKEPFAEELQEIWRTARRLKWRMTKPVEKLIFDLAKEASKEKRTA
jgi:hypothetical protein